MKIYDVCMYNLGEEVGGFHIKSTETIEGLMEFIKDNYDDIVYTSISITEIERID